jgi:hypothetical protein
MFKSGYLTEKSRKLWPVCLIYGLIATGWAAKFCSRDASRHGCDILRSRRRRRFMRSVSKAVERPQSARSQILLCKIEKTDIMRFL